MRKLSIVALGAAGALALAGCATDTAPVADDVTGAEIRVWLVGTTPPRRHATTRRHLRGRKPRQHPRDRGGRRGADSSTSSRRTSSGSDSPDVVEVGNTQAAAFTSAGAFLDLSDEYEASRRRRPPARVRRGRQLRRCVLRRAVTTRGARVVFYDTAMYEAAGLQCADDTRRVHLQWHRSRRGE